MAEYDRAGSLQRLAAEGVATDLSNEPVIAEEGDYSDGLILIRSGLARISQRWHRGHRTVGYLAPGRDFGLDEVARSYLTDERTALRHSLRAIGFVTAVIVPTESLSKWVSRDVMLEMLRSRDKAPSVNTPARTDTGTTRVGSEMIEFLVANRVHNGTSTMVIDLDRCTRCDDCVRACATVHDNNPRFRRSGLVHNNLLVTQACMQCEDPVCMIECPTGAIYRSQVDGLVSINDPTCIGCSACAKNCPYDAIQMVEIRDTNGEVIRERETLAPVRKATKCDLCHDQLGHPACQSACSHDALTRIDMRAAENLETWLQR